MFTNNKCIRYATAICVLFAGLLYGTGCRNESEDPKEKIASIAFDKERVEIKINEETTVRVTVKPDDAKKNEVISYTSVNDGIIEIREATNDGFIVKGLRGGSTVVTAKSSLVTSYFEVDVKGENILAQYINVAQPVIEISEGERRSTQVSLYGGSVLDNNDFAWRLENGKDNISIDVTANIAVVSGLQRGHQKIIVSHPKADYESEILVFVKGVDETVQYISSQSNVVLVANDRQYHDFNVILVNGKPEDIINFQYEVIEGANNIEMVTNGDVCNVKGARSGTSVIRITHPLAVMEFDIRIIVYDVDIPYIVLDQTFLLMNIGDSVNIGAVVEYAPNGILHQSEFSYAIFESDNNIVEVIQNNNSFYIRAHRGGTARIVISNEQAEMPREILIVVREELVYRDDYYITTSQNVIMTQIGADPVQLNIQLVNGNTADSNNFEWLVDDGTIITVESAHGAVRGNRAAVALVFNAIAVITPKKTGTAKITVSHPKSEVAATVMVKVYPKGTFVEPPIAVGYEGLIKVITGTPKTVQLNMVSGDILNVGALDWSMADVNIATLNSNAHGMVNVLNAVDNGLTRMIVDGAKLDHPHESMVLAGTPEFVDMASVIYIDSIYQRMTAEQSIRIEVKDSQGIYQNSGDYEAVVEDKSLLYAVMIKNQLVLQGKEAGETKVRISHKHAINDITLNVRIDPSNLSIDKPYYISGPEIVGVVRGIGKEIRVSLPGAGEHELSRLIWSVEDTSVASVIANGSTCIITGKANNRQTKIWVEHRDKKADGKFILVYVVENEADLYKIVLGIKKENYLLTSGEEQLITLITNATDQQKMDIRWRLVKRNPNDADCISLDAHYDSAMIRAVAAGNAEIEVSHDDAVLPLTIYVSVVGALSGEKVIKGPAVIELIRGESRIVSVDHKNLTQAEVMDIQWSVEGGDPIANIEGNGDSAYLYGLKKGVSRVKIEQRALGYTHYATLLCANTAEELANMYVMGVESSYHTMLIGEEKRVKLAFGSNGFPETAKSRLVWTADGSGVVRVVGQGESAVIVAENPGEGIVTITDANSPAVSFNETLEIRFLVRRMGESALEFRGHEKMVGIVVGESKTIAMHLYNGAEETTNYSLWEHKNEDDNIININRVDNIINITARAAGQSYITVRYNNEVEARILVYTANSEAELNAYYPILVEKTNYLLQIGETATVKIETLESKDSQNFRDVSWGIENANVIENVDFSGKKSVLIKGRAEGQCIINIQYKGSIVARIFVTVVGNDVVDMTKYIITENIIGMVRGASHSSKIFSNLGSNVSSVLWESLDANIVTVSGSGETAVLNAVSNGEAYVTVSYGSWLKRHILVYVCDTKAQVDAYKAMNMENQYHRAGMGETLILPLYFAPNKTDIPTMWVDKYSNKVVEFRELDNGAKLEATTLNEGVAVLEAVNTGLSNPGGVLRIYIEVSKRYNNAPKAEQTRFLTIAKTVYIMNPDERDAELNVSVSGVGYTVEELANVRWDLGSGGQYVSVYPNGKDCRVRVNQFGLEGEAELTASYVNNEVKIKIIVSRTGLLGFPHIVGADTIRVGINNKTLVEYNVAETASYDTNLFHAEVVNGANVASAKFTGNRLEVEGKTSGQALLRITCVPVCSEAYYKDVMVIVTTTPDGLVYLTTRDNFTQVKIDEIKPLLVEMVGFDNPGDYGYNWNIDEEDKQYIGFSFTGKQAQVIGKPAGAGKTVKITVTNAYVDPLYALNLYVRVSNSYINPVYITTQRNIVSVVEGRSVYLEAELVNGQPGENGALMWQSLDENIVTVAGTGTQAVAMGNTAGIGRVVVSYGPAVNRKIEILIIVERDTTSQGIYITTDNVLVDMKPGDTRQVSVRLIGANDQFGFTWNDMFENNPIEAGRKVVNVITSGSDSAIFQAQAEGMAKVRVTHPKAGNYALDITVYVQLHSKVEFAVRNVTINAGETKPVSVNIPANVTVQYTADQYRDPEKGTYKDIVVLSPAGATTSNLLLIQGIEPGICVVRVSGINRIMSDEIIVEVKPATNRLVQYILTPDSIYNMSDWQSASNRSMISGTTVGEKFSGAQFSSADDMAIQWEITGGADHIGFNDTLSPASTVSSKMVSVYARSAGIGEITVTHPEMANEKTKYKYEKKVYVQVHPYDANFILTPVFTTMQIGQKMTFNVSIQNVEEKYELVKWEALPDENRVKGIYISKHGDTTLAPNYSGDVTGKTVEVTATDAGVFKLTASFNNSNPLEAIVYIEKKKNLEILDESFIKLLPGETRFIGIHVEPEDADINYQLNYGEFLTVDHLGYINDTRVTKNGVTETIKGIPETIARINRYTGEAAYEPLKSKFEPAKISKQSNRVLAVTGTDREGFTQIRLTSNFIERMLTVNTNYNYMFFMEGYTKKSGNVQNAFQRADVVRGKPNDVIKVSYSVFPPMDKVQLDSNVNNRMTHNGRIYDVNPVIRNDNKGPVKIDYLNQTIEFTLDKCGYTELKFASDYNREVEIYMVIPVYVYYDRIDLQWESSPKPSGSFKSRLDSAQNAIYIADGETLEISYKKDSAGYATGYYGENIYLTRINNQSRDNIDVFEHASGNGVFINITDPKKITITNRDSAGASPAFGNDSLLKVDYIGTIKIEYIYAAGSKTAALFTKTFMVYKEKWSRR